MASEKKKCCVVLTIFFLIPDFWIGCHRTCRRRSLQVCSMGWKDTNFRQQNCSQGNLSRCACTVSTKPCSCCSYLVGRQQVMTFPALRGTAADIVFLCMCKGCGIHLTQMAWQQRRICVVYWRIKQTSFHNSEWEEVCSHGILKSWRLQPLADGATDMPQTNHGISVTFHAQVIAACCWYCFSWHIFLCRNRNTSKDFMFFCGLQLFLKILAFGWERMQCLYILCLAKLQVSVVFFA